MTKTNQPTMENLIEYLRDKRSPYLNWRFKQITPEVTEETQALSTTFFH